MSDSRPYTPGEDEREMESQWSLASTANDLYIEHGRRYPNYRFGYHHFPRGDELATQNEIALYNLNLHLFDDRPYTAPIQQPRNVLDVRCGHQGLWAKHVADLFPDAQVTGFDVFTPDTEGRQNLDFILQSYNDDWILDEVMHTHGKFDLIYAKSLMAGSRNYPDFYRQCLEHLEPGGYFEQTEVVPNAVCDDGHIRLDSTVLGLIGLRPDIETAIDTSYDLASHMKALVEKAGFVDIQERRDRTPWSPWVDPEADPKGYRTGQLFQRFYETGIQGWLLSPLVKHLNFTPEQVDARCERAIAELQQNDQHIYSHVITITARRAST